MALDNEMGKYLSSLNLSQGDAVDVSICQKLDLDPEEGRPEYHAFRLEVNLPGEVQRYIKIARALASTGSRVLSEDHEEALDKERIKRALKGVSIDTDHGILAPFSKVPNPNLENRMLSQSVVYVFSGFVGYAAAINDAIAYEDGKSGLTIMKRPIDQIFFDELVPLISGIFREYKDLTIEGARRLKNDSGKFFTLDEEPSQD